MPTDNVNTLWMYEMALYLFPFSKTVNKRSHSDDTNTEKHVVLSHSHKLLSKVRADMEHKVTVILQTGIFFPFLVCSFNYLA